MVSQMSKTLEIWNVFKFLENGEKIPGINKKQRQKLSLLKKQNCCLKFVKTANFDSKKVKSHEILKDLKTFEKVKNHQKMLHISSK